jgi:hypothetical protein
MHHAKGSICIAPLRGFMLIMIATEGTAMIEVSCTAGRSFSFEPATSALLIVDM